MNEDKSLEIEKINAEEDNEIIIKKEKKKIKPIIIIIVSILLCGIFGTGGWFLGTKLANKEEINNPVKENINEEVENKEETSTDTEDETIVSDKENIEEDEEDEIEFIPDEKVVSTISEEFEISLYNSKTILKSNYEITKKKVLNEEEKEIYVYALYREIYFNNESIADKHMLGIYDALSETKDNIDIYSLKDYKTIKDSKTDDVYLLVNIVEYNPIYENSITYWDSSTALTYIINKQGKVLSKIKTKYAGTGVMGVYVTKDDIDGRYYTIVQDEEAIPDGISKDNKYILYSDNRLIDLHDNYLYYFTYQDSDDCSSNEHKIVIENGNLIDTKVKTFDDSIVDAAGQTC